MKWDWATLSTTRNWIGHESPQAPPGERLRGNRLTSGPTLWWNSGRSSKPGAMTIGQQAIHELAAQHPAAVDFIRQCPYGLVVEEIADDGDVILGWQPTFVILGWGAAVDPICLVAPLVRLGVTVLEDVPLDPSETGTSSLAEELVWFYSYARAKAIVQPDDPVQLLAPRLQSKMAAIVARIHAGGRIGPHQVLQITQAIEYNFPGCALLAPVEDAGARAAWRLASEAPSYQEFFGSVRPILGIGDIPLATASGLFHRLERPNTRLVVMHQYGRRDFRLATDRTPWVGNEDHLRRLLAFTLSRPLLYADHDMDRPIALVANPHLAREDAGALAIHGSELVIDEIAWKDRDRYRGFSLGVKHGPKVGSVPRRT